MYGLRHEGVRVLEFRVVWGKDLGLLRLEAWSSCSFLKDACEATINKPKDCVEPGFVAGSIGALIRIGLYELFYNYNKPPKIV